MITHALRSLRVERGRRLMTALCGAELVEPARERLQACTVWDGDVECLCCKRASQRLRDRGSADVA